MSERNDAPAADAGEEKGTFKQENVVLALSAFGLMADLYDFGVINLVRPMLEAQFGSMTPSQDSMVTGAALLGAILGQLGFGAAADYLGRRVIFISTAVLVCLGSIGSACASSSRLGDVYYTLTFWRFVMGLGIGGEYPLAAASVAENGDLKSSARSLATVFGGMALGQLLGPSVVMLLSTLFEDLVVWRMAFAFGAVLSATCACLRFLFLEESQRWRRANNERQNTAANPSPRGYDPSVVPAAPERGSSSKGRALFVMWWSLAGTAGAWLLYDVVTYGVGLFSTEIFPAAPGMASARMVLYINCISLPGYIGAVIFSGMVRMRHLQIFGLTGMAVCFLAIVAVMPSSDDLGSQPSSGQFSLWLFGLQRAFDVVGPGVATFTIPAQIYPTRVRGTAHGISAAAGKLGAVVGTTIFPHLRARYDMSVVMAFMAVVSLITALWTMVFVPLYDVADLEAIGEHDVDMTLTAQAAFAERVLYTDRKQAIPLTADVVEGTVA